MTMEETGFDLIRDMEKWREQMNGKPMSHEQMHMDTVLDINEGKEEQQ